MLSTAMWSPFHTSVPRSVPLATLLGLSVFLLDLLLPRLHPPPASDVFFSSCGWCSLLPLLHAGHRRADLVHGEHDDQDNAKEDVESQPRPALAACG